MDCIKLFQCLVHQILPLALQGKTFNPLVRLNVLMKYPQTFLTHMYHTYRPLGFNQTSVRRMSKRRPALQKEVVL